MNVKAKGLAVLRQERIEAREVEKDDGWVLDQITVMLSGDPPRTERTMRRRVLELRAERERRYRLSWRRRFVHRVASVLERIEMKIAGYA